MNSLKDENGRPTMIGISSVDGKTVKQVLGAPNNDNSICVSDAATGSDVGNNNGVAVLDDNSVACLIVESSTGDNSLVNLYVDDLGNLLVNSA